MQNRAIRLMASKLAVAGIIEGNFTDEGLAAMSDCADMTTALARELTQGIRNEVEDLSAVFKKMAILKPAAEQAVTVTDEGAVEVSEGTVIVGITPALRAAPAFRVRTTDDTAELTVFSTDAPTPAISLLSFVSCTRPARAIRGRTADETDITSHYLFEESMAA